MSAVLSWVNLFTRELEALPEFYRSVFGLEEIEAMRNPVFRGLAAGGVNLGFMDYAVYAVLGVADERCERGARSVLTFEVASSEQVDELTLEAVELGATLEKAPSKTAYGWYQSVLLDPEGHVLRVNKVLA